MASLRENWQFDIMNNYQIILFAVKPFLWKEAERQTGKE